MKKLHIAHSQKPGNVFPGADSPGMITTMWLEDEEGNKISDEEMKKLFLNLEAIGYWVKRKTPVKAAYQKYSFGGMVTTITQKDVILNGKDRIPKSLFHKIYTLD